MRNRAERLEWAPDGRGARCDWLWTSDLHIARVFPSTARRLLDIATADWPIVLGDEPPAISETPDVSFLIGHRGMQRLPHLLTTLRGIAAQKEVSVECIVVEQSNEREIAGALPEWVRYIHTPLPRRDLPYCRAWSLNVAARAARGRVLVLQDNDLLLPQHYAAELVRHRDQGARFIDLKRLSFYVAEAATRLVFERGSIEDIREFDGVVQNLQGASIAADREAYFDIGGFDESFVGWGGEDNDFWDRARTMKVYDFGYLPAIHLWHAPQPEKASRHAPALARYQELRALPVQDRIRTLRRRAWGSQNSLAAE